MKEFEWTEAQLDQMENIGKIKYLVVHHSASGDAPVTTIDAWHKAKGYIGLGYHYVLRQDGSIEKGRPDDKQGAQAYGYNNCSLGIVLTGDFTDTAPAPAQLDALVELLKELKAKCPAAQVVRHSDLCETSCPGAMFPWDELTKKLKGAVTMPGSTVEPWKQEIMDKARTEGLITSDHRPDDPAPKWFVLAVVLNLLKVVKK